MLETPTTVVDEKKAMEIVSKMTGKDGILTVIKSAVKSIDDLKTARLQIDSQISAYGLLIQTLRRLAAAWGLDGIPEVPYVEPLQKHEPDVDAEVAIRVSQNLCLYKDRITKQWCSRTLSADERKVGYCKTCQVRLNMIKETQVKVPQESGPSLRRRGKT